MIRVNRTIRKEIARINKAAVKAAADPAKTEKEAVKECVKAMRKAGYDDETISKARKGLAKELKLIRPMATTNREAWLISIFAIISECWKRSAKSLHYKHTELKKITSADSATMKVAAASIAESNKLVGQLTEKVEELIAQRNAAQEDKAAALAEVERLQTANKVLRKANAIHGQA